MIVGLVNSVFNTSFKDLGTGSMAGLVKLADDSLSANTMD